jgi:MFS family permease
MLPRINSTSRDWQSHRWLALTGIVLASFVGTWDGTAPVVIIPAIMKQYNVGVDTAGLFLTVGLMFFAVPMAATGKLGDVWGHKRLYLISSLASSLMAGMVVFAPSFGLLITFRAVQGISSTPTYTATLAYIAKVFPVHERGRAMGIMGMTASLAWAIGPAVGGFLTDTLGWRAVILAEIPLSLIAFLAAFILMPPDQDVRRSSFDLKGMISFTLIALIMMLASRWVGERTVEPLVVVVIIISLIFLIIFFLRTERRQKEPFIPLSMFFEKRFTLATAFSSLQMAANFSIALLASIYLQVVRGYSAGEAGLIVAGVSIARVFLDPLAGRISELWGVRAPSIIGTTLYSLILLLIMFGHPTPAPDWLMFVIMFVLGVGVSMSRTPVNMGVTTIVREKDMGLGLGVFSMLTYLGGAFGQAISGSLLRIVSKAGNQPLEWIQQSVLQKSFTITFGALFAIGILAWFISFGLPSRRDVVYADG